MNAAAFLLLSLTGVAAVLDWMAVGTDRRQAEYVLKPLTMVGLILVALALDSPHDGARVAVVAALVLSMLGDVFLMLPRDLFVAGLASFLAAHVAYVVAIVIVGTGGGGLLAGLVLVAIGVALIGTRILAGARRDDPALVAPVALYLAVISVMVVTASGTGRFLAVAGALLFYASDAVLGWTKFVGDFGRSRVVVMVTYHLGQALLVLGLLS